MLDEIELDVERGSVYVDPRLSNTGQQNYLTLLRTAVENRDIDWLADEFRGNGRMRSSEPRRKPSGGFTTATVPESAAETLAEGEFNRYYIRALCRRAIEDGMSHLVVYRAKPVANPRPESETLIGSKLDPRELLDDLRSNPGAETELRVPGGPNSGLSVRLPPN
jgi:hypothetical protein